MIFRPARAGQARTTRRARRGGRCAPAAVILSLLPGIAQAHLVSSGLGPFYDGALHLLLSPLDLLALLSVVLLAGQGGKAPARWTVVALPVAWGMAWVGAVLIGERVLVADLELDWIKIILLTAITILRPHTNLASKWFENLPERAWSR